MEASNRVLKIEYFTSEINIAQCNWVYYWGEKNTLSWLNALVTKESADLRVILTKLISTSYWNSLASFVDCKLSQSQNSWDMMQSWIEAITAAKTTAFPLFRSRKCEIRVRFPKKSHVECSAWTRTMKSTHFFQLFSSNHCQDERWAFIFNYFASNKRQNERCSKLTLKAQIHSFFGNRPRSHCGVSFPFASAWEADLLDRPPRFRRIQHDDLRPSLPGVAEKKGGKRTSNYWRASVTVYEVTKLRMRIWGL